jgi:hypothetical protein
VWASPDIRERDRLHKKHGQTLPRTRGGAPVDIDPLPADSAWKPFAAGDAAYDVNEDVVYRVVKTLNPLEGWASSQFWQERWGVEHRDVVHLVRTGLLDAAAEEGSLYRRYRCRDEYLLKQSDTWKVIRRRILNKRSEAIKTAKYKAPEK